MSEGINRYNAVVFELSKRPSKGGLGGRFSYTYSVLKDNQIGETNFYTNNGNGVPVNNYNYIASAPACAAGQQFTTACYDPRAEYQTGVLDVPHRFIIAPIWQLPSPSGKGGVGNWLAAGWTAAAVPEHSEWVPSGVG